MVKSMVQQTVWRFSCMIMLYNNLPNRDTPTPFCELRAFKYLLRKPVSLAEISMLKKELTKAINELIDKPGLQKLSNSLNLGVIRADDRKCTNLEEFEFSHLPSGKVRVMINGFEKEPIDVIEAKVHVDNTDIKHKIIKNMPQKITYGYIFRYVAFFGREGKIKAEYDEFDILNGALD
jgi:hypothetical protein